LVLAFGFGKVFILVAKVFFLAAPWAVFGFLAQETAFCVLV
jgi:hypothetical protein